MMHNYTIVRVIVSREVLDAIPSSREAIDNMAKFFTFRKVFETVASDKFDRGNFKSTLKLVPQDLTSFADALRSPL